MNDMIVLLLSGFFCVILLVWVRTILFSHPQPSINQVEAPAVDPQPVAEHLSAVIQCKTISYDFGKQEEAGIFEELHARLASFYPRVQASLHKEIINNLSLLYTWQGSQPELKPILLAAHQDVVPAGSPLEWRYPPYDGVIAGGGVWGRGSLDIKSQLIAAMEAVEYLLNHGFQPKRTLFLAFGHDEEVGGSQGAGRIVEILKQRSVSLDAVMDEGGFIMNGVISGVNGPVAMIGTAEKGYLTLELKVQCSPGHSSIPPRETAIGILGKALARLDEQKLPPDINLILPLLRSLGNNLPFKLRMMAANLWLFKPFLLKILNSNPQTSAAIRTTTAPTMISGGTKENILPHEASALVNFRLVPGETSQDVIRLVSDRIQDDRVKSTIPGWGGWPASPQSPINTPFYLVLERLIRQNFDNPPVAPYLVLGGTDARYYAQICPNVFRFTPLSINSSDLKGVHGLNESIRVEGLVKMVQFFIQLIQQWDDVG